jgi:hypothetical protein
MVKLKQRKDYTWQVPNPKGTWLICPDRHHAPPGDEEGGIDPAAFSCMLQGIDIIKPDGFIDLGDIGEWSSCSPWQYKRRSRPPVKFLVQELMKDVMAVNKGQDDVDEALARVNCKRKIQILGNHEVWPQNMMDEWKDIMDPRFKLENLLQLKERGYACVPYGDYVRLGKLFVYHGGHCSSHKYHTAQHLRELGASVMYGHQHDYQVTKVGHLGQGLHAAWCIGFLGNARKPFMKGKPTNWSHNFGVVHVEKDGSFHVEVIEIFNGSCYIQGKKVTG